MGNYHCFESPPFIFFFLNFILELPASVDYVISPEENSLWVIPLSNWEAKPSSFWSRLWFFGFLSLANALYSVCAASFGWLGVGSLPQHTQPSSATWPERAGQEWILCWIPYVQVLVPIDNGWGLSSQFQRSLLAQLCRKDLKKNKP